MKAILEFELPSEEEEFRQASRAGDLALNLFNIQQEIRNIKKYREFKSEETKEVVEEIYNIILEYTREE